jgi:hypothetical protein
MRIRPVVAAAVTAVAVSAVGVSAYTAGIGQPSSDVIGFGETAISGATMVSSTMGYSTDHSSIDTITVVLDGDTHTSALSVSNNRAAPVACAAGTYNAGTTKTTYVCTTGGFAVNGLTTIGYVLD